MPLPTRYFEDWPVYTSKRYHYVISYPQYWTVTPGSVGYPDTFDEGENAIQIARYGRAGTVSMSQVVHDDIAWYKTNDKAKLVSNKAVKVAGWSGRLLSYRGTYNGSQLAIQSLLLAKGRILYNLTFDGSAVNATGDAALFERVYVTFKPT
jgi:hypothetical protein